MNIKQKLVAFLRAAKDKFLTLSLPIRIAVGAALAVFLLAVVMGIMTKTGRAIKQVATPDTATQPAKVGAQATAPAPAATTTQAPAPAAAPATAPAPAASPAPVVAQAVTPIASGNTGGQSMSPALPLTTAMLEQRAHRVIMINEGRGPSDFLSEDVQKFGFSADSSHKNGFPKQGSRLITEISGYVRIDQPGPYTWSVTSRAGRVMHSVDLKINDAPVASATAGDTGITGQDMSTGAISPTLQLKSGWYKVAATLDQDYREYMPVTITVQVKGASGAMQDVVPALMNPVQPVPAAPAPAPAAQ